MFNYTILPSSSGSAITEKLTKQLTKQNEFYYTAYEGRDENEIYDLLNKSLTKLETAITLHEEDLVAIETAVQDIVMSIELKEEVLLRIDWMKRLYEAQQGLSTISTVNEAQQLRSLIASVQTCPLKGRLSDELTEIIAASPNESKQVEKDTFDQLMEHAINQAGEEFINLGLAGREQIVEELLTKDGPKASIESIQEATANLEQKVTKLHGITHFEDMKRKLEDLPLPSFTQLAEERKDLVASKLIEGSTWQGLASLDRMIHQLNRAEVASRELNLPLSDATSTATSLDVSSLDYGKIRYN